jgi:large subunit ribosomal protein L23
MNAFEIVKTVRLTEKGTRQGTQTVRYHVKSKDGQSELKTRPLNQYTVVADPRANKFQIRQAVQELFKVKVIAINTLNVRGKPRRQRTKQAGKAPDWKKAIVTLKQGDKIVIT